MALGHQTRGSKVPKGDELPERVMAGSHSLFESQ